MLIPHPHLLPLLPLLPPLTHAITIATQTEAAAGHVWGFTGDYNRSLITDFLTSTFCYCSPTAPDYPPSHYYQIDYYNKNADATLISQQTCLHGYDCRPCMKHDRACNAKHNRFCSLPKNCLPEGLSEDLLVGSNQRSWERVFKRDWYLPRWLFRDKLVYQPDYKGRGRDFVRFDGKERDLSPRGGQGMEFVGGEEVGRVCGRLCGEQFGTGVLGGEGRQLSLQVMYIELDDMCYACK